MKRSELKKLVKEVIQETTDISGRYELLNKFVESNPFAKQLRQSSQIDEDDFNKLVMDAILFGKENKLVSTTRPYKRKTPDTVGQWDAGRDQKPTNGW